MTIKRFDLLIHGLPTHRGQTIDQFHQNVHRMREILKPSKVHYVNWSSVDTLKTCGCIDLMVVTADPGPLDCKGFKSNVNRQVVAVRCGLAGISEEYTLKVRSDVQISSKAIVEKLHSNHKVRVTSNGFLNPIRTGVPFNVPDVVQFGRTEVLRQIWCQPNFTAQDLVGNDPDKHRVRLRHLNGLQQDFTTEQLMVRQWAKATNSFYEWYPSKPEVREFSARLKSWEWMIERVEVIVHRNSGVHMPHGMTATWVSRWRFMPSNPDRISKSQLLLEYLFFRWGGSLMPDVVAKRMKKFAARVVRN